MLKKLVDQLEPKQIGVYIVHNARMVDYVAELLLHHHGVGLRRNRNVVLLPNGARIKIVSAPDTLRAEMATHGCRKAYVDHTWWEWNHGDDHTFLRSRVGGLSTSRKERV